MLSIQSHTSNLELMSQPNLSRCYLKQIQSDINVVLFSDQSDQTHPEFP